MSDIIKLIGAECDEIALIDSKNSYKNGKKAEEGKTFSRFRFNGVVFTVDNDSPFIEDFNNGKVSSVKLIKGERTVTTTDDEGNETEIVRNTFTFDSHSSMVQELNRAKHAFTLNKFTALEKAITEGKLSMEDALATV